MSQKVWGGRFQKDLDDAVDRFNASLRFDFRLYPQEIEGGKAHARMLAKQKIISDEEASQMVAALSEIKREMDQPDYPLDESHEDVHSLVEKALVAKIGPLGEKLHTGRSRNDLVAFDVRLYVREAIGKLQILLKELQRTLVDLAERNVEIIVPGYTHLQRAQPVLVAHHLLAYYEMLKRDRERLQDSLKRVNILPLGSAALAGSTFDFDRTAAAEELGFEGLSANSMDAVSDRDFVLEFLFSASVLMMHLSRFSEELIIWSTQEFGFVNLPDAFCTGSSIMPQKKNPDLLELVRAKTGRLYGHLMALMTMLKGLPLTYNKDLQEDKEALFDSVDTTEQCLIVITRLLKELSFDGERMKRACDEGYLVATDLADYLVHKGTTFRQAHEAVGKMVLYALEQKKELKYLSLDELTRFSSQIESDVYEWLEPEMCVQRRNLRGGTGPEAVAANIRKAKEELGA